MDKLAIIGTGYMAKIIATRANELGIEPHCFSIDDNSVAAEVAHFHRVNVLDVDSLTKVCRELGINGVVATTELTIWPANQIAFNLGLNGNDVDVAKEITDKTIIRKKTSDVEGLSQPKYWICHAIEELPEIVDYPVVVKPIAAGGKRGVSVVYGPQDIEKAMIDALKVSKVEGVLIEEYLVGGQEYSVESISFHGHQHIIQVTLKDSSGPPHCVELGHHQPAPLSKETRNRVEDVVSKSLSAAGITNGPCHTEIKIIDDRIYLIEINGRPGGDHIAYPMTELSTGYPYITGIIMAALDKFDESQLINLECNYCGLYFVTTQTANLKPIFDTCDDKPWLYQKNKVSDELTPITHNDGFNTNYFMYFSSYSRPDINV